MSEISSAGFHMIKIDLW